MNLKLNIYNKKEVVKTYTADTFYLCYGTVEDLVAAVDLEKINNNMEIGKMVIKLLPQIKPLLCEIFDGLTEEEIRHARVNEMIPVFIEAFKYSFNEISKLGGGEKN